MQLAVGERPVAALKTGVAVIRVMLRMPVVCNGCNSGMQNAQINQGAIWSASN